MQAATGHSISNALSGLIGLFCVTPVHGLASLTGGADLDFERTFKGFRKPSPNGVAFVARLSAVRKRQ
jgi:hypothetical protein